RPLPPAAGHRLRTARGPPRRLDGTRVSELPGWARTETPDLGEPALTRTPLDGPGTVKGFVSRPPGLRPARAPDARTPVARSSARRLLVPSRAHPDRRAERGDERARVRPTAFGRGVVDAQPIGQEQQRPMHAQRGPPLPERHPRLLLEQASQ